VDSATVGTAAVAMAIAAMPIDRHVDGCCRHCRRGRRGRGRAAAPRRRQRQDGPNQQAAMAMRAGRPRPPGGRRRRPGEGVGRDWKGRHTGGRGRRDGIANDNATTNAIANAIATTNVTANAGASRPDGLRVPTRVPADAIGQGGRPAATDALLDCCWAEKVTMECATAAASGEDGDVLCGHARASGCDYAAVAADGDDEQRGWWRSRRGRAERSVRWRVQEQRACGMDGAARGGWSVCGRCCGMARM